MSCPKTLILNARQDIRAGSPGRLVLALALAQSLLIARSDAQEWPRFRGPNGSGVSTGNIPAKWTDDDYTWKVSLR